MTDSWKAVRAAALWVVAAAFALFGVWTLGQGWMLLETNAGWRALAIPVLATIGAISLTRRAVERARQPATVRLDQRR